MVTMGLWFPLVFGAFMALPARDIKRLFAYSSIEHMALSFLRSEWAARSPILQALCTW